MSACVSSSESLHAIPAAAPKNAGFARVADRCCTCGCTGLCHRLTEGGSLRTVVERWLELPEYVRQAVRTLVDAAGQPRNPGTRIPARLVTDCVVGTHL